MGLSISDIASFPAELNRRYFVYFLDYGWDGELSDALHSNAQRFAMATEQTGSVLIRGAGQRQHFANQILSWHSINQNSADELLPAILITDTNPWEFYKANEDGRPQFDETHAVPGRFLILPLKDYCKTKQHVADLLHSLSDALQSDSLLENFEYEKLPTPAGGLADALIIRPSLMGIGVDMKKLWELGSNKIRGKISRDHKDD